MKYIKGKRLSATALAFVFAVTTLTTFTACAAEDKHRVMTIVPKEKKRKAMAMVAKP